MTMEGAVEVVPRTHLADVICDLVSTGSTLISNGLVEKDVILKSQAVLVTNKINDPQIAAIGDKITSRIKAVLRAENSRYIMLNSPTKALKQSKPYFPSQSPTVMPLQGCDDMVAVHAVLRGRCVLGHNGGFKKLWRELHNYIVPIEKMLD